MRVALCVIGLALAGCVSDGTLRSGSWQIDQRPDLITGKPVAGAVTIAAQASNSTDPLRVAMASLQLTCFENRPVAKINFSFRIGSDRNTSFGYRFNDKPGHDAVESRVLLGLRVIVIEDAAALQQFVADLHGANRLVVRIRSLNAGTSTAVFPVDGSDQAIEAAYRECPLSPAQEPRRTT
ncbi:hypothetical protein DNX69_25390 [Rhodopseudomonas palustris]|uniref:Lipoprotein n=1 Tax=Rhodopseudomonas palustris TaxID=1076 RepID=A0A323UMY8_RHOPL|nr:hypothetical protein DNX69_25390 [Rhodopseudomonas palustris]